MKEVHSIDQQDRHGCYRNERQARVEMWWDGKMLAWYGYEVWIQACEYWGWNPTGVSA